MTRKLTGEESGWTFPSLEDLIRPLPGFTWDVQPIKAIVVVVETVTVAMVVTADTTEEVETVAEEVMDVARLRLTDPDPIGIIDPALDLTVLVVTKLVKNVWRNFKNCP